MAEAAHKRSHSDVSNSSGSETNYPLDKKPSIKRDVLCSKSSRVLALLRDRCDHFVYKVTKPDSAGNPVYYPFCACPALEEIENEKVEEGESFIGRLEDDDVLMMDAGSTSGAGGSVDSKGWMPSTSRVELIKKHHVRENRCKGKFTWDDELLSAYLELLHVSITFQFFKHVKCGVCEMNFGRVREYLSLEELAKKTDSISSEARAHRRRVVEETLDRLNAEGKSVEDPNSLFSCCTRCFTPVCILCSASYTARPGDTLSNRKRHPVAEIGLGDTVSGVIITIIEEVTREKTILQRPPGWDTERLNIETGIWKKLCEWRSALWRMVVEADENLGTETVLDPAFQEAIKNSGETHREETERRRIEAIQTAPPISGRAPPRNPYAKKPPGPPLKRIDSN